MKKEREEREGKEGREGMFNCCALPCDQILAAPLYLPVIAKGREMISGLVSSVCGEPLECEMWMGECEPADCTCWLFPVI